MGSGKSTVGRSCAATGWKFVDADDVIAAEAGSTIPEIFAREEKVAFRERERATSRGCRRRRAGVALGGGAIEDAPRVRYCATHRRHCWFTLRWNWPRRSSVAAHRAFAAHSADQANLASRYQRRFRLPNGARVHRSGCAEAGAVVEAIVHAACRH